jgi:hypothetical protein
MFHGTNSPAQFDELGAGFRNPTRGFITEGPEALPPDLGIHATPDPAVAQMYAGIDYNYSVPEEMIGGRIMPVLVDKGNVLQPKVPIVDSGVWNERRSVESAFRNAAAVDPMSAKILNEVKEGGRLDEVLRANKFDSMDYLHSSPYAVSQRATRPATMVLDPEQVVNRFSPKGMGLDFVPSKLKKPLPKLYGDQRVGEDFYKYFFKNE